MTSRPATRRAAAASAARLGVARRRGSAILMLVVLLFILFGVIALVIDLGVARSTHGTMLGAARSGALEGLRHRDNPLVDGRVEARDIVAMHFVDGLDGTARLFGAGPQFDLVGGGQLNEFALIEDRGPYRPFLQLNDGTTGPLNEPHGDMLTGTYDPDATHISHIGGPYQRADFAPWDGVGPEPPSFLVRIRRTSNRSGLDDIDGVSSRGRTIPYLWGMGALLFMESPEYDPRREGVSVLARAIADAQPALSAGPAFPPLDLAGTARFALEYDFWQSLPAGVPVPVELLATGLLTEGLLTPGIEDGFLVNQAELDGGIASGDLLLDVATSVPFPPAPFLARIGAEIIQVTAVAGTTWTVERGANGTLASNHPDGSTVLLHAASVIGDEIRPALATADPLPGLGEVLVPIYQQVAPLERRLVGFGRARLEEPAPSGPPFVFPLPLLVTKEPGSIAWENASASPARALEPGLTPFALDAVFAARQSLADPVSAPALVRAYGK